MKKWSKKYLLRVKGGEHGISGIIIIHTVINGQAQWAESNAFMAVMITKYGEINFAKWMTLHHPDISVCNHSSHQWHHFYLQLDFYFWLLFCGDPNLLECHIWKISKCSSKTGLVKVLPVELNVELISVLACAIDVHTVMIMSVAWK